MNSDSAALPATVLVTGAAGGLGQRTLRALSGLAQVRGLDLVSPATVLADLTHPPEVWQHHLDGAEVVIHLAGDASPAVPRPEAERQIIGMTRALLQAATRARVRRIVYASSCHVLAGYRYSRALLPPDAPPFPVTPYGWSKTVCEDEGRAWAEATGGTFLALRIGMCLRDGKGRADGNQLSRWSQSKWLTGEDYAQAIRRATTAKIAGFHTMTIVSAVAGATWDLSAARRLIGYEPTPMPAPRPGAAVRLAELRDRARIWAQGGPRRYG